jgi:biotin carboxyl carrier protein
VPDASKPRARGRDAASGSAGEHDPISAAPDSRADIHDPRSADERAADHAAIDRLAEELLPALVAKLSASGLGEIEVGEGSWTVRVRRTADAVAGHGRRLTDRPSRSQPGHAGHGHAPGGFEGHRGAREAKAPSPSYSTNGATPATSDIASPSSATAAQPASRPGEEAADRYRVVATSPAVGVFQPRVEAKSGTRVRSGDRLGAVDMLGIPQEVVAPADGIVGASLVEPGQTVEYGQELVIIELAGRAVERTEA